MRFSPVWRLEGEKERERKKDARFSVTLVLTAEVHNAESSSLVPSIFQHSHVMHRAALRVRSFAANERFFKIFLSIDISYFW